MSPTVSVIIPNYNHAPYLKERIDSVLNQTYQDFEVIILDDCSPDNSVEVIEQYRSNPHVSHILINEQNTRNTFIQWERGISMAKGRYIWIAESDDVAEPQLLETLIGQLEQHPDASVAFCHSRLIDADGALLSEQNTKNPAQPGQITIDDSCTFLRHLLIFNYIYNASMAVFRRDVYDRANPDYKQFRYCGDWHFWASVCAAGRVIEVYDMLSRFRQHQRKVTEDSKKDVFHVWNDEMKTIRYIASLCKLTTLEQRCLKGRLSKRLRRADMTEEERQQLRNEYPTLCSGNTLDIICYELGKNLFGFLRHRWNIGFLSNFSS
jgi:glycosyltransferase involved in cell wall biosynthesis